MGSENLSLRNECVLSHQTEREDGNRVDFDAAGDERVCVYACVFVYEREESLEREWKGRRETEPDLPEMMMMMMMMMMMRRRYGWMHDVYLHQSYGHETTRRLLDQGYQGY